MNYFNEVNAPTQTNFKLIITCQVGKSLDLAKFAIASAIENAGMEFRKDFEICFICWRTSEEVYEWLNDCGYWYVDMPCEDFSEIGFVKTLYRGWRLGHEIAYSRSEYHVPIATDHYFFPGWLWELYKWAHPQRLISCTLIEPGPQTLHPMCNLGMTTPDEFNYGLAEKVFEEVYTDQLIEDKYDGYYHLDHGIDSSGRIRQDAMPFVTSKWIWENVAEMGHGFNDLGVTSDSAWYDDVRHSGKAKCYRSCGSVSYHFGGVETKRNLTTL